MRNKKFCIPMLLVVVILLLGGLLVIGVFQLTPHIQSAKLCSMINAGDTESAIEYIEKVAREKLGLVKENEIIFIDVSGE